MAMLDDDDFVVRDDGPKSTPHPEGQFAARCVDAIPLGDALKTFGGGKPKVVPLCMLVFRTGAKKDTGEFLDLFERFTVSLFRAANLRKFLEQWRGKRFTEAEVEAGISLKKLIGQNALVTVAHNKGYANVTGIAPLHPAIPPVPPSEYTRGEWVARTREKNARAVAAHTNAPDRMTPPAMPPEPWDGPPPDEPPEWDDE